MASKTLAAFAAFVALCPGGALGQPALMAGRERVARAFEIVRAIDYLPYDYREGGCYVRSFFIAMELAAEGIPSSHMLVTAPVGSPLVARDGTRWGFHVAPIVRTRPGAPGVVMDPAMVPSRAGNQPFWALNHWLRQFVRDSAFTTLVPGWLLPPDGLSVDRLRRGRTDGVSAPFPETGRFEDFEKFSNQTIGGAFSTLNYFLTLSGHQALRPKVRARMEHLVRRLDAWGKLDARIDETARTVYVDGVIDLFPARDLPEMRRNLWKGIEHWENAFRESDAGENYFEVREWPADYRGRAGISVTE